MAVPKWLKNLVPPPPLTRSHFDVAMAEQTKIIEDGNTQVLAALADMAQQMSELTEAVRCLLAAHGGDAGNPAPPDDAAG